MVHWITQSDPKAGDAHAHALLARPNVRHWSKATVARIEGGASGVTGVQLKPKKDETEAPLLPVDGVFIYGAGSKPCRSMLKACWSCVHVNCSSIFGPAVRTPGTPSVEGRTVAGDSGAG